MSIELRWHDREKTIIYMDYGTHWTWDDYYISVDKSKELMNQSSSKHFYIIADMSKGIVPRGSSSHGNNVFKNKHPLLRFVVVVTENAFVRMLTSVSIKASTMMRENMRIAATIEEAEKIIEADRSKRISDPA